MTDQRPDTESLGTHHLPGKTNSALPMMNRERTQRPSESLVPSLPMRGRAEISKRVRLSIIKECRLLNKLATERELLGYAEMLSALCGNTEYREGIA
jgi:hypothetical protein